MSHQTGGWNDLDCATPLGYVCEYGADPYATHGCAPGTACVNSPGSFSCE